MGFPWGHPRRLADCIPQEEILQEQGITLSGAWLGRGFHEDGFVARRWAAAIVSDKIHVKTPLYEDLGHAHCTSFFRTLSFTIGFAIVVATGAFGAAKVAQQYLK